MGNGGVMGLGRTPADRFDDDDDDTTTFGPSRIPAAPSDGGYAAVAIKRNRWLHALRPRTVLFALIPTLVALELVLVRGVDISPLVAVAALVAVVLVQAGASLLDAYVEYSRHAHEDWDDAPEASGLQTLLARCGIYPLDALRFSVVLFVAGCAAGAVLAVLGGFWVGLLGALGLVAAVLYSSTSVALKRSPLGDALIVLALGPGILAAVMIATQHRPQFLDLVLALALGFFALAPLEAVHLRDVELDRSYRSRTLGAILGTRATRLVYALCLIAGYTFLALASLPPGRPHGALLAFAGIPALAIPLTGTWRAGPVRARLQLVDQATAAYAWTGLLLVLGLLGNILAFRLNLLP